MRRSMVFEGVAVTLLILLAFLMLAMVMGESVGNEYIDVSDINDFPYTHAGQDNTLYLISGKEIRAIDIHGNRLWNYTVPDQWRVCGQWAYSPPTAMIATGHIADGGPIVASDNGTLYVYLKPAAPYRTISQSQLLQGNLIAISRDGKVTWSLPLESLMSLAPSQFYGDTWSGDVSLAARDGRVYAFHDYNETVIDAGNGAILWNIANVSDPGSVDEAGFVYLVHSGGSGAEEKDANYYRQYIVDYRSPSGIVEAYYPNGSSCWQKDMGKELHRQYIDDRSLPLYQNGLAYVPMERGVTALYRNGTVKWEKAFKPDEFEFNWTDKNSAKPPGFNATAGDLSFYRLMPFDLDGNLYLQYVSCFGIQGKHPAYSVVIGPDGRELSKILTSENTYKVAKDGIGYRTEGTISTDQSGPGDPKNCTLHAYDVKSGKELWHYTFDVKRSDALSLDRDKAWASFGRGTTDGVFQDYYDDLYSNGSYYMGTQAYSPPTILSVAAAYVYPGNGMAYVKVESIGCEDPLVPDRSKYSYYSGIYAFDEAGRLIWHKSTPPMADPLRVMPGGMIFYTTEDGRLVITGKGAVAGFTVTAALYIFIRFLFVGVVARARSRLSKNENRNRIFDFVVKNPGSTLYEISRGMGMNMGTIRYHTAILGLNHRIVASRVDGKYIRYFTNSNAYDREDRLIVALMRRDAMGKVLDRIYGKPGISNAEMARDLGMPESVVFRRAKELMDKGIVVKEVRGRECAYMVDEKYREHVARAMERIKGGL